MPSFSYFVIHRGLFLEKIVLDIFHILFKTEQPSRLSEDRRPLGTCRALFLLQQSCIHSTPWGSGHETPYSNNLVVNKVPEDKHNESQQLESDGSSVDEFPLVSGLIHSCRNGYQNPNDPDDHSPGDVANRSGQGVDLLCDCHPCHVESSDGEDPQDAEE
jgi:hypothetical protein